MPSIQTKAATYASVAEMRAAHAARKAFFKALEPPPSVHLVRLPAAPPVVAPPPARPSPVAVATPAIGDDAYAAMVIEWGRELAKMPSLPNGRRVCEIVGHFFSIPYRELVGATRRTYVVHARQIAGYICIQGLGFSHPMTGRVLGGKDPTTSLYGYKRVLARMRVELDYAHNVATLMQACGCPH